ncbi:porin [Pseudomonas psychrotolerans]|nr:porin [Pseudomonas psychrotolerans]
MRKIMFAAALAAGAGVAQAEPTITLYGLIDTGISYYKVDGGGYDHSHLGMTTGNQDGSRWGLRGSDDLGDGLRVEFVLESGFDSTNGQRDQNGRMFGRQATIGIAHDAWGSLEFGRQQNMASRYLADIDPFYTSYTQANMGLGFSAANTYRLDNMIMYRTPSIGGLELGLGYSFGVDGTDAGQRGFATADNARGITAGVRYLGGPLNVTLTFDQLRGSHAQGSDTTPRQYALGVAYDFEVIKLAAVYADRKLSHL